MMIVYDDTVQCPSFLFRKSDLDDDTKLRLGESEVIITLPKSAVIKYIEGAFTFDWFEGGEKKTMSLDWYISKNESNVW